MTSDAEYCMSERSIESVFNVCLLLSRSENLFAYSS